MRERTEALLTKLFGDHPRELSVSSCALTGGLEAAGVHCVTARYCDPALHPHMLCFVVKRLEGQSAREAEVYKTLVAQHAAQLAPRLLHVETDPSGATLYLELVSRCRTWPWDDVASCSMVLAALAGLHRSARDVMLPPWDYEQALADSAASTLELMEANRSDPLVPDFARAIRVTRRLIDLLPSARQQMLELVPLGCTSVHGDVHSGNALIRSQGGREMPVLLDWGRARRGSPLEELTSAAAQVEQHVPEQHQDPGAEQHRRQPGVPSSR